MSLAALLLAVAPLQSAPIELPTGEDGSPWILEEKGVQAFVEGDRVVQVVHAPRLSRGGVELRAKLAVFWLDAEALATRRVLPADDGAGGAPEGPRDLLETLDQEPAGRILLEAYFEGPIEYYIAGEHVCTARALYLDFAADTGWIADAELFMHRTINGRDVLWRARAAWMRRDPDASLRSNEAVLTPCSFVDRHLSVRTEELVLARVRDREGQQFEVELTGNSLEAYDLLSLPLPDMSWSADDEGRPLLPELSAGSSARFGTFISTGLSFDAEDSAGWIHNVLPGGKREDVQHRTDGSVHVSWLGSRGILLDLGATASAEGLYEWETWLGGLVDGAEDRGLLRVDEDDRDPLRTWLRSRGRFRLGPGEWVDLALSHQSDPGVQAEFWEDEFLEYEESDTYLHWRRGVGGDLFTLRVSEQLDSHRSDVNEWPAARAWLGRRPVATVRGRPLLYTSDSSAAYLSRIEGLSSYGGPFDPPTPWPDGLGERQALRFDSRQRLELPWDLGAGWSATPFAEARLSAWDEGADPDESPVRFDTDLGLRLTTALWRRSSAGTMTQVAPFFEARTNVVHEAGGGDPVPFDQVEIGTDRDRLSVGLRGRTWGWDRIAGVAGNEEFDFELAATQESGADAGSGGSGPAGTGWRTLDGFAGLRRTVLGMPVSFSHDGRYGLDHQGTLVSHSRVGLAPTESLGVEFSHHYGLAETLDVLYEAASVEMRYRWTPKWEFEARQTVSFLEGQELANEVILRRYGHDLVLDIGVGKRSGEGGATITFRVRPELLFRAPRIGFTEPR